MSLQPFPAVDFSETAVRAWKQRFLMGLGMCQPLLIQFKLGVKLLLLFLNDRAISPEHVHIFLDSMVF